MPLDKLAWLTSAAGVVSLGAGVCLLMMVRAEWRGRSMVRAFKARWPDIDWQRD